MLRYLFLVLSLAAFLIPAVGNADSKAHSLVEIFCRAKLSNRAWTHIEKMLDQRILPEAKVASRRAWMNCLTEYQSNFERAEFLDAGRRVTASTAKRYQALWNEFLTELKQTEAPLSPVVAKHERATLQQR